MSHSPAQSSAVGAATDNSVASTGVVGAVRHRVGQTVGAHPVGVRLALAEVTVLVLGVGLSIADVGSQSSGASLTDVFATLSFVVATIIVVAAAVTAVVAGLFEGYWTVRGRLN